MLQATVRREVDSIESIREFCDSMLYKNQMISFMSQESLDGDMRVLEGHFLSPLNEHCPGVMPKEVEIARLGLVSCFTSNA